MCYVILTLIMICKHNNRILPYFQGIAWVGELGEVEECPGGTQITTPVPTPGGGTRTTHPGGVGRTTCTEVPEGTVVMGTTTDNNSITDITTITATSILQGTRCTMVVHDQDPTLSTANQVLYPLKHLCPEMNDHVIRHP